ncbi:MAG: hypothetical protein NC336_08225 [Clostridium sp.]|nr:hypothetical protein [Clostridium sp.]
MRKLIPGAALTICAALGGCFTGVDSTPKITASDVRRASAAEPRPEESYLDSAAPETLGEWRQGKVFVVTDPKISLVFNDYNTAKAPAVGSHLRYTGSREVTDFAGRRVTEIHLADSLALPYVYTVVEQRDSLLGRQVAIPCTVDLDMVGQASALLLGKTFYVMTSTWRDNRGQTVPGRKYIPVEITAVGPATEVSPVAVEFHAVDEDARGIVMLDPRRHGGDPRAFASLFSFSDPRKRYPAIRDEAWRNITFGMVAPGMTRDECRLSLGSPADVTRSAGYSYLHEAWRYDTGMYLIFEDGILTSIKR